MKTLTITCLFAVLIAVPAQSQDAKAKAALSLTAEAEKTEQPSAARALANGTFLIWVGDVAYDAIPAQLGDTVEISGPHIDIVTGKMRHVTYATLSSPTIEQVKTALATARATWKEVAGSAAPKSWPPPSARHDDDLEAAGPWPSEFPMIDGMKRYVRAAFTQSLDRVGSFSRSAWRIRAVPRSENLRKWQVSGGMEFVHGFRSDLYKNDVTPVDRMALLPVVNSSGDTQYEFGHARTWPDGARFLDVLSNEDTGKVFEIRSREKKEGRWKSLVIFDDEDARPIRYKGLGGMTCASCHDQAGTGGYSTGLVPGGDGVISFPFANLRNADRSNSAVQPEEDREEGYYLQPARFRFRLFR